MKLSVEKLTGFAPSRRWNARWVWPGDCDPKAPNTYMLFRKTLAIGDPAGTRIFISADTRYQLYVNGRFVDRGQPLSQPYYQYYNQHDLGDFLTPGTNCIGVIVYHLGTIPGARGGLLAELVDGEGKTILSTDASWSAQACRAWNAKTFRVEMNVNGPFQEHFDAREFPHTFAQVDFDDSGWAQVGIIKGMEHTATPPAAGPWTCLVPRDIPYPSEAPLLPERIEQAGEALGLINRTRGEDLTIGLSQPIAPLRFAQLREPENLLQGQIAATVCCSTQHLADRAFDGIYEPCIILDFGKIITAYLQLDLEGPAGATVDMGYAERLIDGHFINMFEGQFADRFTLAAGRQTFTPFQWRAFRYVKLRVRNTFEPLKIHAARAMVSTYPYEERGQFQSSDDTLNRIFEISRHTLRLCSHEAIMDTPWRESAQWLGDVAAVTVPAIYACFGDTALAGKFYRQAAMNLHPNGLIANISNSIKPSQTMNRTIPDYSLWYIVGLWGHYLYTGEERWIDNCYPQVLRILQTHLGHLNERGLIEDMPFWVFIDWADTDRRGECAAYNAIFYGALECVEHMAELRGDHGTLAKVREVRTALKANFSERFFDPARGLLADARIGGLFSEKTSEQANFAAIRFGLLAPDLAKRIVEQLFAQASLPGLPGVTEAQPFFMVVVLQALQGIGRMDLALKLLRDRWDARMLAHGATSTFEEWTINGSRRSGVFEPYMRTLSHAWSACPAEFLIRNLIGLEIHAPGCGEIRLAPAHAGFDYDVTFPLPQGPLHVTHKDGKFEVKCPPGVRIVS